MTELNLPSIRPKHDESSQSRNVCPGNEVVPEELKASKKAHFNPCIRDIKPQPKSKNSVLKRMSPGEEHKPTEIGMGMLYVSGYSFHFS